MHVAKSIKSVRALIKKAKTRGRTIGFVPTMGALHEGHASLLNRCRKDNDVSVLSIFVNPKQFGPDEDFAKYPRPFKNDAALAKKCGVDIIFRPSVEEMYPKNFLTSVKLDGITNVLCGRSRPEHFNGVATVVEKLLNIIQPDTIYLGQKDAQQVIVLKKMIRDLNIPVTVNVCPTIRERDGLALSSRNKYLTSQQRQQAPVLYSSLKLAQKKIIAGERNPASIIQLIRSHIEHNSTGRIDYVECVAADSLQLVDKIRGKVLIALAVWFGKARLIDNILLSVK